MTDVEWQRALEWLDAWSWGVATVNAGTAESREGYMRTLREIQALPECEESAVDPMTLFPQEPKE